MPEDQVIATQDAMRTSDPNGKFYGMIYISLYQIVLCNNVTIDAYYISLQNVLEATSISLEM